MLSVPLTSVNFQDAFVKAWMSQRIRTRVGICMRIESKPGARELSRGEGGSTTVDSLFVRGFRIWKPWDQHVAAASLYAELDSDVLRPEEGGQTSRKMLSF
mmetsp:Transcript_36310/g.96510  ORF Transcript_36310/g.96510 Transcript_36310/m.96510 type:complete len:101 (-) Transcript_36310:13-315(-)